MPTGFWAPEADSHPLVPRRSTRRTRASSKVSSPLQHQGPPPAGTSTNSVAGVTRTVPLGSNSLSNLPQPEDQEPENLIQRLQRKNVRLQQQLEIVQQGYSEVLSDYANTSRENVMLTKKVEEVKDILQGLLMMKEIAERAIGVLEKRLEECKEEKENWECKFKDLLKNRLEETMGCD